MDQKFGQIGIVRKYGNTTRTGAKQAAFLITKPQYGSDLSEFATTFKRVDGGFVISGIKDWITGAARREFFITLAKKAGAARMFGVFLIVTSLTPTASVFWIVKISLDFAVWENTWWSLIAFPFP